MSDKKSMSKVELQRKRLIKRWGNRHFTNMLDEIVSIQKKFASRFIPFNSKKISIKEKWTKELIICMVDELSEVLNQVNWKHWKKNKIQVNSTEVKYELIDLLCFLINIMVLWGMDEKEIFSMYISKNWENLRRQREGY